MLNKYTILSLLMCIALISSMPADSDQEGNIDYLDESMAKTRATQEYIDGSVHQIKTVGTSYRQRLQKDQCLVEYDGQLLAENSVIQIRKKYFRVENCLFERVFHACGPNLIFMLNIVCRVVEQDGSTKSHVNTQRDVHSTSTNRFNVNVNKTPRMITESCCENLCNVAEISRYCQN